MMDAAAVRIAFGEDQAVAGGAVDGADVLAVRAEHFHMLADLAEQAALLLALATPVGEVVLELRLMLAAEIVIVAVELVDVPPAKLAIMTVVEAARSPGAIISSAA